MFCWFLPYNKVNQPEVCIYLLPLETPSHITPQPHHTPLGHIEHQAELLVLYNNFPLAIYFKYGSVDMSKLLSI